MSIKALKYILPFFISFPAYLSFYASLFFFSLCSEGSNISKFIWGFNVINSIFGAPLLGGIFTDAVGVINMLPIYDLLLITGQIIVYFSLKQASNEGLMLIGLFFTNFTYGLKETSRIVYMANTFIEKKDERFNLRGFACQSLITGASRYVILLLAIFIQNKPSEEICSTYISLFSSLCLGVSVLGLIASLGLMILNKMEMKEQREEDSLQALRPEEGRVFLGYNSRLGHNEDEGFTLVQVIEIIFTDKSLRYVKFWLLGCACLGTIATLSLQSPLFPAVPYLNYSLQFVITILLVWGATEKRMRFLTIFCSFLMVVYQIYFFFQTDFVQWAMILALPIAMLLTDIYTPIALNYDLRYLGIAIGMKKWFENFFMLIASIIRSYGNDNYGNYYMCTLAVCGFTMNIVFNEFYLKCRSKVNLSGEGEFLLKADELKSQIGQGPSPKKIILPEDIS